MCLSLASIVSAVSCVDCEGPDVSKTDNSTILVPCTDRTLQAAMVSLQDMAKANADKVDVATQQQSCHT